MIPTSCKYSSPSGQFMQPFPVSVRSPETTRWILCWESVRTIKKCVYCRDKTHPVERKQPRMFKGNSSRDFTAHIVCLLFSFISFRGIIDQIAVLLFSIRRWCQIVQKVKYKMFCVFLSAANAVNASGEFTAFSQLFRVDRTSYWQRPSSRHIIRKVNSNKTDCLKKKQFILLSIEFIVHYEAETIGRLIDYSIERKWLYFDDRLIVQAIFFRESAKNLLTVSICCSFMT